MFNIFKSNLQPKTNGYYIHRDQGISTTGDNYKLTIILIFNVFGVVFNFEIEGFPDLDISTLNDTIIELNKFQEPQKQLHSDKFKCNNSKISMLFQEGMSAESGWEYKGEVKDEFLLLDMIYHSDNWTTGQRESHIMKTNLKYDFIKIES